MLMMQIKAGFLFFGIFFIHLHELHHPFIHFNFWNYSVLIGISIFHGLVNLIVCDIINRAIQFIGNHFLMNIQDDLHKVIGLIQFEGAAVVVIILGPDLINHMFNQMFVITLGWVFGKQLRGINSLGVLLTTEDGK